ncbi:heme ABC transporter ATP-binding protein [Chthonobacter rhizosphaerae]|uniref:heme ABC transporter ATP-binding protein n=1 Tax=Chthonobacter rhizosphaerae TaxID=2735553 RepID=UPI0015EF35DA|nr:heme ABC transporter ATP-binding protein [Chthonobacter rhizosphaerae]
MITAHSLTLARSGRSIVDDVSLRLEPGRVSAIIGPNGAGKSTLLKMLTGELAPSAGTVAYGDQPIGRWTPRALARRRAVLPQSAALAFSFTVHEIVRMGAVASGLPSADGIANDALARVGLSGFGGRLYQYLSGGEQQRVQFARALAQVPRPVRDGTPRFLFLDEPTSSLDLRHQIGVLDVAKRFARDGGGVVAVLHDLNLVAEFADTVFVLDGGRLVAAGPPVHALSDGVVADVYGVHGTVCRLPAAGMPFVLPQARTS